MQPQHPHLQRAAQARLLLTRAARVTHTQLLTRPPQRRQQQHPQSLCWTPRPPSGRSWPPMRCVRMHASMPAHSILKFLQRAAVFHKRLFSSAAAGWQRQRLSTARQSPRELRPHPQLPSCCCRARAVLCCAAVPQIRNLSPTPEPREVTPGPEAQAAAEEARKTPDLTITGVCGLTYDAWG
jgi:hypothetical protein